VCHTSELALLLVLCVTVVVTPSSTMRASARM
jgi:hypothetical protein